MKSTTVFLVILGISCAQYGPPKRIGPKKHRTTTTEAPLSVNEISPNTYFESGQYSDGSTYQISANSVHQPGISSATASSSIFVPGPSSPYDVNIPTIPTSCNGGGHSCSQNEEPLHKIDISKNPFLSASLSGKPLVPSEILANSPQSQNKPYQPNYSSTKPTSHSGDLAYSGDLNKKNPFLSQHPNIPHTQTNTPFQTFQTPFTTPQTNYPNKYPHHGSGIQPPIHHLAQPTIFQNSNPPDYPSTKLPVQSQDFDQQHNSPQQFTNSKPSNPSDLFPQEPNYLSSVPNSKNPYSPSILPQKTSTYDPNHYPSPTSYPQQTNILPSGKPLMPEQNNFPSTQNPHLNSQTGSNPYFSAPNLENSKGSYQPNNYFHSQNPSQQNPSLSTFPSKPHESYPIPSEQSQHPSQQPHEPNHFNYPKHSSKLPDQNNQPSIPTQFPHRPSNPSSNVGAQVLNSQLPNIPSSSHQIFGGEQQPQISSAPAQSQSPLLQDHQTNSQNPQLQTQQTNSPHQNPYFPTQNPQPHPQIPNSQYGNANNLPQHSNQPNYPSFSQSPIHPTQGITNPSSQNNANYPSSPQYPQHPTPGIPNQHSQHNSNQVPQNTGSSNYFNPQIHFPNEPSQSPSTDSNQHGHGNPYQQHETTNHSNFSNSPPQSSQGSNISNKPQPHNINQQSSIPLVPNTQNNNNPYSGTRHQIQQNLDNPSPQQFPQPEQATENQQLTHPSTPTYTLSFSQQPNQLYQSNLPQTLTPPSSSPSNFLSPPKNSVFLANPNNPFLGGNIQNPSLCTNAQYFCVPAAICRNGIISDSSPPESKYQKGQCSQAYTCCRSQAIEIAQQPNIATEPAIQKYTGPLNTTPPPGCAAALKCVPEIYCTADGVMSNKPLTLTREQIENKVPLTDCQDMDTGVLGKCCRDPNYKDPWPAGMMMNMKPLFDDGQYHPEQYPGNSGIPQIIQDHNNQKGTFQNTPGDNPYFPKQPTITPTNPHTIKKPLGVFNTVVTPFPVAPKPGQTHSQVFPQNEDKIYRIHPIPKQPTNSEAGDSRNDQNLGTPLTNSPSGHPVPSPPLLTGQSGLTSPYQPQGNTHGIQPPHSSSQNPYYRNPFQSSKPHETTEITPVPQTQQLVGTGPTPIADTALTPHKTSQSQSPGQINPGQECGIRKPVPPTNPDETGFGEFPWHVVILSAGNRSAICSGAIIAPNAVITAAHCIEGVKPEDMVVKAGEWALGQPGKKPVQMRVVGASAVHPVYNAGSLVKDQAIVVLEKPFSFEEHIDKICLPLSGTEEYSPKTNACFLTGWGRPALQNNALGSILHKVPVTVVPKEQCESSLKKTHLGKYFILNQGFTCAAPPSEADLCKIDIGSPLICDRGDGHYELAGIYSWDTKCSSNIPGVMATSDTIWINQVLSTPLNVLKKQQNGKKTIVTFVLEDIDSKPGFALGYGK